MRASNAKSLPMMMMMMMMMQTQNLFIARGYFLVITKIKTACSLLFHNFLKTPEIMRLSCVCVCVKAVM
jgi:hypothetical protein